MKEDKIFFNGSSTLSYILSPKVVGNSRIAEDLSSKALMRLKWIDYINAGHSIMQASRHFDKPESSIRYWYHKFNKYNLKSLEDKSKKPFKLRRSNVSETVKSLVIELRKEYQGWGKQKIQRMLKERSIMIGQSRIQKIINEAGLKRLPLKRKKIKRLNRKHMYTVPKENLKIPGGLVYFDVKHLTLTGGIRAYQFTAIDHATRILQARVYPNITSRSCVDFLQKIQGNFPFKEIKYLGSDNGSEFLGELEDYLKLKNINHVFSSPRSPKQNPFVERVIRTIIDEVYYYKGLEVDREAHQVMLDKYIYKYNYIRPHHSLKLNTPMQEYARILFANSLIS